MALDDLPPENFLLKWKELFLLHKIPGDISEALQEYLFHQRKDCSAAVRDTLRCIPNQSLKHPLVLSLTNSLTSFCDWIRKSSDVCSSSTPIRFFRILYSLGISIYFLRLIFEMSSEQSAMRLHSLPIAVRKSVVQCLSIIGFNCSDYQVMISSPEAELTHLLAEKFSSLFPEIISPSSLLNQRLVICFFHSCYNSSCPCLVEDLFGDMEDMIPSPFSDLGENVRHSKLGKEEIPVLATPPSDSPLTNLSLHVGALATKNERNALLSRCRTSPMNGHRLALERRLQKQPVAPNHHSLTVSNSVKDVGISRKRSFTQESNLKGNNRRRLVVEDTPVRNSSK